MNIDLTLDGKGLIPAIAQDRELLADAGAQINWEQ